MTRAIVIACLAACAYQHPRVRASDVATESVFVSAIAVDWLQSGPIVAACVESNPAIGRCGERVPLGVYLPLVVATQSAIALGIPPGRWRTLFVGAATAVEIGSVSRNLQLGWMP